MAGDEGNIWPCYICLLTQSGRLSKFNSSKLRQHDSITYAWLQGNLPQLRGTLTQRSAFALSDPTPALLQLIKAHPTANAVRDLLLIDLLHRCGGSQSLSCICIGIRVGGSP